MALAQTRMSQEREGAEGDVTGWALSLLTDEECDRMNHKENLYKSHTNLFPLIRLSTEAVVLRNFSWLVAIIPFAKPICDNLHDIF